MAAENEVEKTKLAELDASLAKVTPAVDARTAGKEHAKKITTVVVSTIVCSRGHSQA